MPKALKSSPKSNKSPTVHTARLKDEAIVAEDITTQFYYLRMAECKMTHEIVLKCFWAKKAGSIASESETETEAQTFEHSILWIGQFGEN